MYMRSKLFVISLLSFILAFCIKEINEPVPFTYPKTWPKPVYDFSKNPLRKETIALGRKLFYEPLLSGNNTISCSSCHLSFTAFTHVDHARSHGINDSIGSRNSPALMNLAWSRLFMWDGAVNHLDVQALAPIHHPAEMGENIATVVNKLKREKEYVSLFKKAYSDSVITGERILKALAQFQLTLVSANSKYDKIMRKEKDITFTGTEHKGYALFKKHCNSCHTEPLFSNYSFANSGLMPDSLLNDSGRMRITHNPKDYLKFKIPTLRNIEFSYPYMHDGRFKTIGQVLNHYSKGVVQGNTLAAELKNGIALNADQKTELHAFLLTLSDKEFLFNPDFGYPKK